MLFDRRKKRKAPQEQRHDLLIHTNQYDLPVKGPSNSFTEGNGIHLHSRPTFPIPTLLDPKIPILHAGEPYMLSTHLVIGELVLI